MQTDDTNSVEVLALCEEVDKLKGRRNDVSYYEALKIQKMKQSQLPKEVDSLAIDRMQAEVTSSLFIWKEKDTSEVTKTLSPSCQELSLSQFSWYALKNKNEDDILSSMSKKEPNFGVTKYI